MHEHAACRRCLLWLALSIGSCALCRGAEPAALPGTAPLIEEADFSAEMIARIDRYLTRATERSIGERGQFWKRDLSTPEKYTASVEPNRQRLRTIIGA